ncbi:hypothetical protein T06_4990 [Trichinella sp. T6]|nr:hypothetical protein T06_4990 [Trichinella sp. T6]
MMAMVSTFFLFVFTDNGRKLLYGTGDVLDVHGNARLTRQSGVVPMRNFGAPSAAQRRLVAETARTLT